MNEKEIDNLINNLLEFTKVWGKFVGKVMNVDEFGIPRLYIGVLNVIRKNGSIPISHIGEKMSISKSNMTPIIDVLEEKGYIIRCDSKADRRIVNIQLTEKGTEFLDTYNIKLKASLKDKIALVPEGKRNELNSSLNLLIDMCNTLM